MIGNVVRREPFDRLRSAGREVRDVRCTEAVTLTVTLPDADIPAIRAWLADATAGGARLVPASG